MRPRNLDKIGTCPSCGKNSSAVKSYYTRTLKHFAVEGTYDKVFTGTSFRCENSDCKKKVFSRLDDAPGIEDVKERSRYTESSKMFAINHILTRHNAYNDFKNEVKENLKGTTSVSTLHTWVNNAKIKEDTSMLEDIEVLHTDEKHPSKKKKKR